MNALLQAAIDSLEIQDVYLYSSQSFLAEGFEPRYDPGTEALTVKFKHAVTHTSVLEFDSEEGTISIFRVFIELGARWIQESGDGGDSPGDVPKAQIEGVMVAEYRMSSDPGQEPLKEFALRNASYHVWPFWREFLATQGLRMNLPKLVLPTRQIARNHPCDDQEQTERDQ